MKSIVLCAALLAVSITARGMTILETLDPFAHPGSYYGGIYFTFNVTDDSSPDIWSSPGSVVWHYSLYDVALQGGAQTVTLGLHIGTTGYPNAVQFAAYETVIDPTMPINGPSSYGVLGSKEDEWQRKSVTLRAGSPGSFTWTENDAGIYYDYSRHANEAVNYGLNINFSFDGETAVGTGTWHVSYLSDNPVSIVIVPEPSSWLLGAIGLPMVAGFLYTRRKQ